jgi:ASC-1-like (ASCH) protein
MNEIDIESTMVEAIRNGDKTIEVRLAKPRFLLIQEDDILSIREDFYYEGDVLESLSNALKVKVIQILYFESFRELFDAIHFEAVLPSAKTDREAIATFRKLYSAEDEAAFGVAAFTIEPILA